MKRKTEVAIEHTSDDSTSVNIDAAEAAIVSVYITTDNQDADIAVLVNGSWWRKSGPYCG